MSATIEDRRFTHVEQRADFYRSTVESDSDSVMESHKMAMICFEFADLVVQGCDLYGSITRLDEDWRMLVFKGEVDYCPKFETRIENLYRSWLDTSDRVLALYARLDREYIERGFDTEPVDDLRRFCQEVKGILTEDGNFFSHEKMFSLARDAVAQHRRNETADMNG